jgi:hypothetical protein
VRWEGRRDDDYRDPATRRAAGGSAALSPVIRPL